MCVFLNSSHQPGLRHLECQWSGSNPVEASARQMSQKTGRASKGAEGVSSSAAEGIREGSKAVTVVVGGEQADGLRLSMSMEHLECA